MLIICHKCQSNSYIKNGFVRGKQRYRCKECHCNFIEGDDRDKYDNITRNLAIRMYLNNCGLRRIAEILKVPLTTIFMWIQNAGRLVDQMVKERKREVQDIEILEMD